jgi:acetyl esterase/lipase
MAPTRRLQVLYSQLGGPPAVATAGSASAAACAAAAAPPFLPPPALKGGLVLPLWSPSSRFLDRGRAHLPEEVNPHTPPGSTPEGSVQQVRGVHNPSIECHLAAAAHGSSNTGCAILLVPGGGHNQLGVANCTRLVQPLLELGITTIIVRPRLRIDGYNMTTDAVWDTQQAMRLVRSRAKSWAIDPHRIGVVGFSAGAELAAAAGLEYDAFDASAGAADDDPLRGVPSRPDFVGLMWPGPTPFETKASQLDSGASRLHGMSPRSLELAPKPPPSIPDDVPPSFSASAGTGDRIHAIWANQWYTAMLDAAVPNIELHLFGSGVHGSPSEGDATPLGQWRARFEEWLADLGFLGPPGSVTKARADMLRFASDPKGRKPVPGQPPAGDSLGLSTVEKLKAAGNFGTGVAPSSPQ